MIKTDKINITINTNKVKKIYEELGYIIPKEYINSVIEIDIKDLNKTSHKTVECECDICGRINKTTYLSYNNSINKHGYYSCSGKCSMSKIKNIKKQNYGDENYNNVEKNKNTCLKKYGVENVFQLNDVKNKIIKTNLEKLGVGNPSQSEDIKNKKIKKCLSNYNTKYPAQNNDIIEKMKNTNLNRYLVENYTQTNEYKEKSKQTNIERYGVDNPAKNYKVKEKSKQTCIERYGVEYPSQNIDIFNKQQKSALRIIKFRDTDLNYQGTYELDFLNEYYDIIKISKKHKSIKYFFENKNRIYYPDFYYEPLNLIIEVKSDYTFNKELNKNLAKRKSCLDNGYNFIFIINKNYNDFQKLLDNI
jgi:hypothetical protein